MPNERIADDARFIKGKYDVCVTTNDDSFRAKSDRVFVCTWEPISDNDIGVAVESRGMCSGVKEHTDVAVLLAALNRKVDTGTMITGFYFWLLNEHKGIVSDALAVGMAIAEHSGVSLREVMEASANVRDYMEGKGGALN